MGLFFFLRIFADENKKIMALIRRQLQQFIVKDWKDMKRICHLSSHQNLIYFISET